MAFSLKPRVGLTFGETRRITLDVLAAGFNIVELDSRDLALRSAELHEWIGLGKEAAQVGSHVTAFAPNFSIPAPQLLDVAGSWAAEIEPLGPPVVKIAVYNILSHLAQAAWLGYWRFNVGRLFGVERC